MNHYTPITDSRDRDEVRAFALGNPADVTLLENVLIDLHSCESCLREREEDLYKRNAQLENAEAEIERLKVGSCDDGCKIQRWVKEACTFESDKQEN